MFKIGPHLIETPFMLAPMAGVSEMPYRVLVLEFGAGLATTELISAKGIFYKNQRTQQYLTYNKEKEIPYSVQLFGGDPKSMAKAAQEAMRLGAHIVDINMGCPVKKVTKTGSGSALLTDPKRAADLIRTLREAVDDQIPITAKIRTGWDDQTINCVEMSKALEDAGCAALGIHGRTRAQAYKGYANWDLIGECVQAVDMPILGNGDIDTYTEAQQRMDETGCAGVLIGRGALGNPWIFKSCRAKEELPLPSPEERSIVMCRHFSDHLAFHQMLNDGRSEEMRRKIRRTPEMQAIQTFRQHLIWYSRGLAKGSEFRKKAMEIETAIDLKIHIEDYFQNMSDNDFKSQEEVDGVNYKQAFG